MRFDLVRRGTWDIAARIADMDVDGVYASLNFPSALGFGGVRLTCSTTPSSCSRSCAPTTTGTSRSGPGTDPIGSSRARSRTCSTPTSRPTRSVPTRAAGTTRSRSPTSRTSSDLPSLKTDYWDPFFAACEETGTVDLDPRVLRRHVEPGRSAA